MLFTPLTMGCRTNLTNKREYFACMFIYLTNIKHECKVQRTKNILYISMEELNELYQAKLHPY